MTGYSNPESRSYSVSGYDFGAAGDAFAIPVPAGARYFKADISVLARGEAFTADTTGALVRLGTAADADKYAELDVGVLADTDAIAASNQAGALKDPDGLGPGVGAVGTLTQLEAAFVAPTGGTPGGIGDCTIHISWW